MDTNTEYEFRVLCQGADCDGTLEARGTIPTEEWERQRTLTISGVRCPQCECSWTLWCDRVDYRSHSQPQPRAIVDASGEVYPV